MSRVQEPPVITIVDPGKPGEPGDVLLAGSERPPFRLPRRTVILASALVLLATAGSVGVRRYRAHRAEVRRAAAAFARADTVHVHLAVGPEGVIAVDTGSDDLAYADD